MAVESTKQPDGTLLVTWETGHAQIKRLAPGAVFFRKVGHFTAEAFPTLVAPFADELAQHKSVVMWCDCDDFETYGSGYRERWTEWFKSAPKGAIRAHILVRSAMVKMGVQVVNLAVRIFEPYSKRDAFNAALKAALPALDLATLPKRLPAPKRGAR